MGNPCSNWQDIPFGESRWRTVVSRDDPGGTELLLEHASHPGSRTPAAI
jgi:hypothetical protein